MLLIMKIAVSYARVLSHTDNVVYIEESGNVYLMHIFVCYTNKKARKQNTQTVIISWILCAINLVHAMNTHT